MSKVYFAGGEKGGSVYANWREGTRMERGKAHSHATVAAAVAQAPVSAKATPGRMAGQEGRKEMQMNADEKS